MIVRLKVATYNIDKHTDAFQFYDSPIKRTKPAKKYTCPSWFQFYDSPIKRELMKTDNRIRLSFQFYDSPIKR